MEIDLFNILNKPNQEDLPRLFKEQGELCRKLKADSEAWQDDTQILNQIWRLLALKTWDPELGSIPVEHRGPKTMKIRWRIDKNDKETLRFQNIFKNRFYLSGEEVATAIQNYMSKPKIIRKYSSLGGFTKIELIQKGDKEKGKPKRFIALTNKSVVQIPLAFPGPQLSLVGTIEFRALWPGKRYHLTTPAVYKNQIPELVDAGVNLFSKEYPNLDGVIARAFQAGVTQMTCISVNLETSRHSVDLAKKYVHSLYAIVGVHPTEAYKAQLDEEMEKGFRELITKERTSIVAIGECGIDMEKNLEGNTPESVLPAQIKWFHFQLELASEFHLPLFLHQRGNFSETISILRKHVENHPDFVLIVNCFNGDLEELKGYLGLCNNVYFVITGLICSDDRGTHLREVVKEIPLDRLLLATDAPHLNPFNMPRPYPRRNEPGFLGHVLVFVAECLGMHFEKLAIQTTLNSRKVFGLPLCLYSGATTEGEVLVVELQKQEDAILKKQEKKPKPTTLNLEENQHIFVLTKEDNTKVAFVVDQKEKSIMEKQQTQKKSVTEMLELAKTIELKVVSNNTNVMKGEEVVYTNVVQPKNTNVVQPKNKNVVQPKNKK